MPASERGKKKKEKAGRVLKDATCNTYGRARSRKHLVRSPTESEAWSTIYKLS